MVTRVAFFVPSLRGGGAERVMVFLANRFADKGFDVDLVLAQAEGPYLDDVSPSVRLVDLGARRVATSFLPLVRYLRRERPSSLLSTLGHADVTALLAKVVARTNTRLVIRLANVLNPPTNKSLKRWFVSRLVRWTYPLADHIVAVSDGVAQSAVKAIPSLAGHVTIINNPVSLQRVVAKGREPVTHPWFASGAPPVVLGVGRLTKQKDFATLIRAFAKVRQTQDARLLILGEGEQRQGLQALVGKLGIDEFVSMPGFADNPYAYVSRASLFVLSSRWEGFPNVLLEAIALGTPVVATNCLAGPADILREGRLAPLVPVGDVEAMADAILLELERGPGPRGELQRRAADFSPEAVVDKYLMLLSAGSLK